MKSNNILLYIFIAFVIILITGAIYIIYNKNNTQVTNDDNENTTVTTAVSVVENMKMGIANYDTMNPILTKNREIVNIDKLIFEPLVNINSEYKAEPCLLKSLNKVNDTKYEIKIDTSIKWQDGSSFIAKDIQYTINQLKSYNSIYSSNVQYIQSVDTPDSETAIINLTQPVLFFEYNLTFPIISSSYYSNEDFQNSTKIPIGTGMYKIASIGNDNILLIRNDRWRNLKTSTPKTESITIHKYNSAGEIFNTFKLGNIDITNTYMPNYYEYVGTMGYNKKEYRGRNYDFISFNCQDLITSDVSVRRAINYAINKNTIVSTVFNGTKWISQGPLDYGSYLNCNDNQIQYNQDTAKEELEKGDWVYANNKWQKNINGYVKTLTLSLIVNKDNQDRINVANSIKEQLSEIGIVVNITTVSDDKYNDYINNKNYQLLLTGITNSINPDLSYFYGNNNLANYNNDSIISKINTLDNYSEIQKVANQEVPYIGLYRDKAILIMNANVGGDFAPNYYSIYYNFEKWFRQQ